ncbi:MAG TPA: S9 family peptidase [Pyrinomonadaceae bacterium]|nr:S9 family peptidase [Pyrinomonadaceae bacterium]
MKRILFPIFLILMAFVCVGAQTPFTIGELLKIDRVSDPQVSPDGRWVAYSVGVVNKDANRVVTQIYRSSLDGGNVTQITSGTASNSSPRWSPDGKLLAFTTGGQIWTMKPDGSDRKQITNISSGAGNPVWSPDGKWIAFNSDVYPECNDDACNKAEDEKAENSKVKAHVTDRLLFRHWVEWRDRKRTHVFVVPSTGGTAVDFTPGDFDSPPYGASTGTDYAFSPDSREIVYLRNPDKIEAISTNSDIYIASLFDKTNKSITASNKGYDLAPVYTPDGKYIIYRSQATEAFEADRFRIMRYNRRTGETVELTRGFDLQADEAVVSPDSKTVYFAAGEAGHENIFTVPVEPDMRLRIATFVKPLIKDVMAGSINITPDGRTLVFSNSSIASPAEIFRASADGTGLTAISHVNGQRIGTYGLKKAESVTWKGALNQTIQGFVIKPANFDAAKKYPLLVLIHGGPQSPFNDSWGYRWNPQVFASAGYVVFMPNPRGSPGFGQKFVNEVSADWGGKAYTDIMNGVADVIKSPFIDRTRIGAAGASYGGYMVDWILGHNNDPRFKFKAFVSHAGVYNLESMAGATEELWFVRWEFKGMPWENPVNYNRWSPNKFVKNFDTPTLVSCGELDFRVPIDQSFQLYTALQLRGVPSKLIVFPDEGHWILKPQNSEFWYTNVLDWFGKYLKP